MTRIKVLRSFGHPNGFARIGDYLVVPESWAQSLLRAGLAEEATLDVTDVSESSEIEVAMLDTEGQKREPQRRHRRKRRTSSS